ncbi:MAG: tetratricopeptide repeat protein [Ilumatobacteraceae bacterium]
MIRRPTRIVLAGFGLGAVLFVAGAIGFVKVGSPSVDISTSAKGSVVAAAQVAATRGASRASLDGLITSLQTRLESTPKDDVSWATLGLAYVQQAKATVNPEFYPRADGALAESLAINDDDNFLAYAGLSALASARHDFVAAKSFAEQGLAINSFSALLYGALSDAELQLGNYTAAFEAVQRMVDLSPDTSSLSRASYTWELRGDIELATELMQRALDDAPTPAARAFALFYLGELAFNGGDADAALDYYNRARAEVPNDPAALAGKAKAEAALGQIETALFHYDELVATTPEPSYIIEFGELLESLGRDEQAQQQYDVFAVTQALFEANGVEPDATPTLFAADHGDPEEALMDAEAGIETRPFLAMYDAYAWALHKNGRDEDALVAINTAMELGVRSALFHYHAGMIMFALGDSQGARTQLETALDLNPYFNPLAAPIARETLKHLDDVDGESAERGP